MTPNIRPSDRLGTPFGRGHALVVAAVLALATGDAALAQVRSEIPSPGRAPDAAVVLDGVVPDEATRQAILAQARSVYGERVVDRLGVGPGAAPPNWREHVEKLITADLKQVGRGSLKVSGPVVELTGEVPDDATGRSIIGRMSAQLNPTYRVRNGLRAEAGGQQVLDEALARRVIEFEPGNAVLTPVGLRTLDALLPLLGRFRDRRLQVVGHTDAQGAPAQNRTLSADRAATVKTWLVAHGIADAAIETAGAGADRPVADNGTAEGRARNRRIEVRLLP